jgi:hypothetical protein
MDLTGLEHSPPPSEAGDYPPEPWNGRNMFLKMCFKLKIYKCAVKMAVSRVVATFNHVNIDRRLRGT